MTQKVLVADDSATIQKFISLALADDDISVDCVADGEQVAEKVKSLRPGLVLVDVFIPGINGYEICSKIKEDPELAGTRVVLMVGAFESFDEEAAARAKCDAHLTKPFDTSELIQLARAMMPDYDARTAAGELESARDLRPLSAKIDDVGIQTAPTLISSKTKESFMGSGRILELFTEKDVSEAKSVRLPTRRIHLESVSLAGEAKIEKTGSPESQTEAVGKGAALPMQSHIQSSAEIPDEVVDRIVERVVRRMSQEVIREIAWEVVPELSDVIIRQRLEELEKKS
jgi:CheY-like chemotaxis protein